jgi:hypothetical protein
MCKGLYSPSTDFASDSNGGGKIKALAILAHAKQVKPTVRSELWEANS